MSSSGVAWPWRTDDDRLQVEHVGELLVRRERRLRDGRRGVREQRLVHALLTQLLLLPLVDSDADKCMYSTVKNLYYRM